MGSSAFSLRSNHASGIVAAVSGGPDSIALMHLWPAGRDRRRPPDPRRHRRSRPAAGSGRRGCLGGARGRRPRLAASDPRLDRRQADGRHPGGRARGALPPSRRPCPGGGRLPPRHRPYPRRPGRDGADAPLPRLGPRRARRHAPETDRQGIRHVRPLLDCPKARLVDLCHGAGLAFRRRSLERGRALCPGPLAQAHAAPGRGGADRRAPRTARGAGCARPTRRSISRPRRRWRAASRISPRRGPVRSEGGDPCRGALRDRPAGAGTGPRPGRSRLENSRLHRLEACTERLREAVRAGEALRLTVAGALVRLDRSGQVSIGAGTAAPAWPLAKSLSQLRSDRCRMGAAFPWQGGTACLH